MSAQQRTVVGVLMAAYNGQAFITTSLESLQRQSFSSWECIVVDDGSTDATSDVVQAMAHRDSRIRLLQQDRHGVSHARNVALAALSEQVQYVALLDSDDAYLPGALQLLHDRLVARPDAVGVFGLAEYMDEFDQPVRHGEHPRRQRARRVARALWLVDLDRTADSSFEDLAVGGAIWPAAVGLHRRDVMLAAGGFDPSFTRQGDWDLYVRMSRFGPFPMLDEQVAWYRRHATNLTNDVAETKYQQERVRYGAWRSPANTRLQRRLVARAGRALKFVDLHREVCVLRHALSGRRLWLMAASARRIMIIARHILVPGPPRPSRRPAGLARGENVATTTGGGMLTIPAGNNGMLPSQAQRAAPAETMSRCMPS